MDGNKSGYGQREDQIVSKAGKWWLEWTAKSGHESSTKSS